MQFSLDRKRRSLKQNQCSASDSVGLIFTRSYRFTLLVTTPSLVKTSLKSSSRTTFSALIFSSTFLFNWNCFLLPSNLNSGSVSSCFPALLGFEASSPFSRLSSFSYSFCCKSNSSAQAGESSEDCEGRLVDRSRTCSTTGLRLRERRKLWQRDRRCWFPFHKRSMPSLLTTPFRMNDAISALV